MSIELARQLMDEFAIATGITHAAPPKRYLWTDAFAVCNFLGLYRCTNEESQLARAETLIDQVHHVLGRQRLDSGRQGWISGLDEEEAERHPTRGGLRIGKQLDERSPSEPLDPQLEWDRDGQYFHYLTKWTHALHRAYQVTGQRRYLNWAVELAVVAHRAFTYEFSLNRPKRMVWKMSIDLTRALVDSMGHHDPLDGLVACLELRSPSDLTAEQIAELDVAIGDFEQMCFAPSMSWATEDPLGIGGLIDAALRIARTARAERRAYRNFLTELARAAEVSLQVYCRNLQGGLPAEHRLAFRELGLSISLRGLELLSSAESGDLPHVGFAGELLKYRWLAEEIETFWAKPQHRCCESWRAHDDINSVMLAASFVPAGYYAANA